MVTIQVIDSVTKAPVSDALVIATDGITSWVDRTKGSGNVVFGTLQVGTLVNITVAKDSRRRVVDIVVAELTVIDLPPASSLIVLVGLTALLLIYLGRKK